MPLNMTRRGGPRAEIAAGLECPPVDLMAPADRGCGSLRRAAARRPDIESARVPLAVIHQG